MTITVAGTTITFNDSTTQTTAAPCKAWVRFDGTTGTRAGSFNVSSVTVNGTGSFTVNFSSALANANYSSVVTPGDGTSVGYGTPTAYASTFATGSFNISTRASGSPTSFTAISAAVFD